MPMSADPHSRLLGFVHIPFTSCLLQRAVLKFFLLVYKPSLLHSSLTLSSHILHSLVSAARCKFQTGISLSRQRSLPPCNQHGRFSRSDLEMPSDHMNPTPITTDSGSLHTCPSPLSAPLPVPGSPSTMANPPPSVG